ncbi:MAG TPA: class I SAM-dependent methyltransferase [Bryobacteraceae bacterium]|nr:class I SAM-dependent methyltransferase [Bryobacteraceae bacterium]
MYASVDFGYPWWLSYIHLPIVAGSGLLFAAAYVRKWSKWTLAPVGLVLLWSMAAFVVARFVLDINGRGSLPTQNFLRSGAGRVLDLGAGTGRSSIMVLEARPQTTLVALDLFGESFDQHFGHGETPQQKLLRNLKAAGVDKRVTIQTADMRKIPFPAASFDGIVSAYAVDHLNREGIRESLAEADRVLKPGGEFLLMLITKEPWIRFIVRPAGAAHGHAGRTLVERSDAAGRIPNPGRRHAPGDPIYPRSPNLAGCQFPGAVGTVAVAFADLMTALRTCGLKISLALRTEIEGRTHFVAALGAIVRQRFADQEIDDAAGERRPWKEDDQDRPKRRAHAAPLGVTVNVSDQQDVRGSGNRCRGYDQSYDGRAMVASAIPVDRYSAAQADQVGGHHGKHQPSRNDPNLIGEPGLLPSAEADPLQSALNGFNHCSPL